MKKSGFFPFLSLTIGLFCLGMVVFPLADWQISLAFGDFQQTKIISPVPEFRLAESLQLPRASGFGAILLAAHNTIPSLPAPTSSPSKFNRKAFISEFTISIPKLRIFDARVKVDAENLDDALALFPGTVLPGEEGNAFISGHSVLPQFFNPKNYKTIFSTLPKLSKGDKILANVAGVEYRFIVIEKRVVGPKDTSILNPPGPGKYLTLMTCVPPGTSLKRLAIICKLDVKGGY